jgi:hypothetical protein
MSKYFYFLMGYKFPIYDSLVKDYLKEINKKFKPTIIDCNKFKGFSSPLNFFKIISEFNEASQIKCFDRLDNLCWLYGKIDKGSFSLILSKDNYKKLIKKINVPEKERRIDKFRVDDFIKERLKKDINHLEEYVKINIFTEDQCEFIEFTLLDRYKNYD